MQRIRTALFVDFDNLFGGLHDRDAALAFALAERPAEWLAELARRELGDDQGREFVVCRCYLNPAGWLADERHGNEQGRLYLQRYRPAFTRAGFEVVDCPNLTSASKNAADIRIVIDALDVLADGFTDEFVLASGDADFTPLLYRLRSFDKRIVVAAASAPASAYASVATSVFDVAELLVPLLESSEGGPAAPRSSGSMLPGSPPQRLHVAGDDTSALERSATASDEREPTGREAQARATKLIVQTVAGSAGAVHLSNLGVMLRRACGSVIDDSNWFGQGSLGGFVRSMAAEHSLQVHGYYVWDPARHEGPDQTTPSGLPRPIVPESVQKVCLAAGLPLLDSECWRVLFDLLAEYANTHELSVNECAVWTRDRLALAGMLVGRREVVAVVVAALEQGPSGTNELPTKPEVIRARVLASSLARLRSSSSTRLSDAERQDVERWLSGAGTDSGWSASLQNRTPRAAP
ncbi:MAG: NYN domain-containing protein [Ilumatobacteraceae bacterium]